MAKRSHNSDELFELKWNNYSNSITEEIYNLRQNDCLVDLTFCCEGVTIGCHKLLIFACSPVLRTILTKNPSPHPIIYVTDIKLSILQAILKYIYQGEVQISKSDLVSFMKAADSFQIRGLQSKRSLGDMTSSTQSDNYKKRRTHPQFDTSAGPSSAPEDPLIPSSIPPHGAEHDASNLEFSEFENECSFGGNDESVDDSRFSSGTAAAPNVQSIVQKIKKFVRATHNGTQIMDEFEQHGALTDDRREELLQIMAEFMAKGIVKGGRSGHESIAEATMMLFHGVFEEDSKTLAETIYSRLGRQTQQRYGAESPELVPSSLVGAELDSSEDLEDFDEFERPLRELKRRRITPYLKQIEHDLMIFVARSLAKIPSKHQESSSTSFIFNPYHKELSVKVIFDEDLKLQCSAICPVCKEMITIGSVGQKFSNRVKYRFNNTFYVDHVKNHLCHLL